MWNLICDRAYLGATINSCFFAGMLIGSLVAGMVSDAWGRKKCALFCSAIMLFGSVGSAFVNYISFFAFLRFVVGFGQVGSMLSLYVYAIELVGPRHRTAIGSLTDIFYNGITMPVVALLSYFIPSWRILLIVIMAPAIILPFLWRWIPESPRWLVAHNQVDEAVLAIQKYGTNDERPIGVDNLKHILQEVRDEQIKEHEEGKMSSPMDLVRTRKIRKWSLIIGYQWFAISLVRYGVLFFFSQLSGDIYLNYVVIKLAAFLRVPFTWIMFLKFGRRIPHSLIIAMAGISLLLNLIVHKGFPSATTVLSMIGYLMIDGTWAGIYLITAELFPTILRNTAQGAGSACARIGGLIAAYISITSQSPGLSIAIPSAIFGCAALLSGILMLWIPETLYSPMRQTIQEAEVTEDDFSIPCCRRKEHLNPHVHMEM